MANFDYIPSKSSEIEREYNVLKTPMEGMRIKTRLKSDTKKRIFELFFSGQTLIEKDAIVSHYDGQYAGAVPFYWTSVPDHVSSESSIYVRYLSMKIDWINAAIFETTLQFEEAL